MMKITCESLVNELQDLYEKALFAEKLSVALKIKELQARYVFEYTKKMKIKIKEMSTDDINALLERLEE